MTKSQAQWAEQHDWWLNTMWNHDSVYTVTTRNDEGEQDITFTVFDELAAWAGY